MKKPFDVAVIGAGSFGTSVAIHIAKAPYKVVLWGRNTGQLKQMHQQKENSQYLPGATFPDTLSIETNLDQAVKQAKHVILAVPSHAFAPLLSQITIPLEKVTWLTKGINPTDNRFLHQLILDKNPNTVFGVLSGPSFAKEVAKGMPTALTLAHNDESYAKEIHTLLHHQAMRVYFSNDFQGVQLAGAMKNVLAIAVGVSDGLGFGANARSALITRGLNEMHSLGKAFQAKERTFMGLTGLGDLLLTATDNQSRNRRFGLALGSGKSPDEAALAIGQVVEGRFNTEQICALGTEKNINLPICHIVRDIINQTLTPHAAVEQLLKRPATYE